MEHSLQLAIAKAKRECMKDKYYYGDIVFGTASEYYLRPEEKEILNEKIKTFCKKNFVSL